MSPSEARKRNMRKRRQKLRLAQAAVCALCGEPISAHMRGDGDQPTLDHVIPRARGGVGSLGNLLLTHKSCNEAKADREPRACELLFLDAVNLRLGIAA